MAEQKEYNLLRGISHPDTLQMAQELFDEARARAREEFGATILNYSGKNAQFEGVVPFLKLLAERHHTDSGNIRALNGGMNANSMIFDAIGPGIMLVDEVLYDRCLQALVDRNFTVIGVPMNEQGIDLGALENLISKHKPSGFWSNIRYNNPAGLYVEMSNVQESARICHEKGVLRILDDAYENCGIEISGAPNDGPIDLSHPSMTSAVLVRLTTKEFDPSYKISWIAWGRDSAIGARIKHVSVSSQINAHYENQAVFYELMKSGRYDEHIGRVNREVYQPRGASLNRGLDEFFGDMDGFEYIPIKDASFFTTLWLKKVDIEQGGRILEVADGLGAKVSNGLVSIAPVDEENQPETRKTSVYGRDYGLEILPTSRHALPVVEKRGFPIRFAPNACQDVGDPYNALKLLKAAYEHVVEGKSQ